MYTECSSTINQSHDAIRKDFVVIMEVALLGKLDMNLKNCKINESTQVFGICVWEGDKGYYG